MRRPFGAGRQVSLFTLGTMRALGSVEQMHAVLQAAVLAGINHLETAPAYGQAEEFLGQALQREGRRPDGGWVITSKLLPGLSLSEGKDQLLKILERLRCRQLDNLAIHGLNRPEHLGWALQGDGKDLLNWAQEEGHAVQVGFSSHGSQDLIAAAISSGRFQFCSLHLHLLDPQRLPLALRASEQGMGTLAISPADKGGRLQAPSPTLTRDCAPFTPLQLAYRFLLAQGISTLSVGATRASDLTLAAALQSSGSPLTSEEQSSLRQLVDHRRERVGADLCGQCQACLPCPNDVPIPTLLQLRNLAVGHDMTPFCQERYNLIGRAGHWWETIDASACQQCGDCLPRCPHQLKIPDLLDDTHRRLQASPRRRLWG